jgi:hypothetical protein
LADNIAECRANILEILADYFDIDESDDLYRAASHVLSQNLVHGDALTMRTLDGQPITFAEWGYLGKAWKRSAQLAVGPVMSRLSNHRPAGGFTRRNARSAAARGEFERAPTEAALLCLLSDITVTLGLP